MLNQPHGCPDWDYAWIKPGDPEMECCTCEGNNMNKPTAADHVRAEHCRETAAKAIGLLMSELDDANVMAALVIMCAATLVTHALHDREMLEAGLQLLDSEVRIACEQMLSQMDVL